MTSEDQTPAGPDEAAASGAAAEPSAGTPDSHSDRRQLNLTDPKAIRALAHPLRWALLEALADAGTLTATQASEMLGESPANCAFHLRTLAKYGFVEEAGGGRGRERPWRRVYDALSWGTRAEDPQFTLAAQALDQVLLDRLLTRVRHSLSSVTSWPAGFGEDMGGAVRRLYLTPEEARELYGEMAQAFERVVGEDNRFAGRRDPERRPPDAVPVEFALFGYPVLDSLPLPDRADPGAGVGTLDVEAYTGPDEDPDG
jgi:predicted transcriptional regulator